MRMLRDAKIKTRVLIGFGVLLVLLVVLTGIGVQKVSLINDSLTQINEVNSVKQRYAINFRGSVHDRAIALRDVVLVDPSKIDLVVADIRKLEAAYATSAKAMDEMFAARKDILPEERQILASIKEIEAKTLPGINKVIELRKAGKDADAQELLLSTVRLDLSEWLLRINRFIDKQEKDNGLIGDATRAQARGFSELMLLVCGVCLVLGGGMAWWVVGSLAPLRRLTDAMLRLADGKLDTDIPDNEAANEVGDITGAVQVFKTNAIEADRLRREQAAAEARAEQARKAEMQALAQRFEDEVSAVVAAVGTSSDHIKQSAELLLTTAGNAEERVDTVESSSAQATDNVQAVATAAGQLAASIQEIARQIEDSADRTRRAAEQASHTNSLVDGLSAKADRIGEVLGLISDIASQTNLLALNATIEAARAGEAGKGFAVVASEVKSLASQTARATDDIAQRIAEIQAATGEAVKAIKEIGATVEQVNQISTSIASAVEEQNAATTEIARSARHASNGVETVTMAVVDVREGTAQTGAESKALLTASAELTDHAGALKAQVDRFLASVRAA
ncbi:methyl-accepting chemotaxis protein [Niveispirillum cyanobacteriorum]|uniref:Methyl-accepting chemotaxis protein n=1 Tax=Niveispirillum cyanobacteriorum TaxID=1612173 RepID=A0A2K9NBT6_9PROT|nr:methyl-accepting chemotaxis protein [Niveispirillum cyanobacteriorum]AUN29996.1 methyl-accepting chemotaxis protein [Niveispirillum cyanobacteriorum]GGE58779.1 methyl-accepting chemotaxis protein [Niveispirillum cyanobacteriorum]